MTLSKWGAARLLRNGVIPLAKEVHVSQLDNADFIRREYATLPLRGATQLYSLSSILYSGFPVAMQKIAIAEAILIVCQRSLNFIRSGYTPARNF